MFRKGFLILFLLVVIVVSAILSFGSQRKTTIFAVGDIMMGRHVETLMSRNGYEYPFENIKYVYDGYDFVMGNLEGPIVKNHVKTPNYEFTFSFKPQVADTLKRNGFNLLNIANNHASDRGSVEETVEFLDKAGINSFGFDRVYETEDLAFAGIYKSELNYETDKFLIVNVHWGNEYQSTSNQAQRQFAHDLIDRGADLVIGHHPHVVQEIEEYNGKLIFYSLGNFIFDQDISTALAVSIELEDFDKPVYRLVPIQITNSRPSVMSDPGQFLQQLAERSNIQVEGDLILY